MRDHLGLPQPEIPVLDTGADWDIRDAALRCPLKGSCRRRILLVAGANFRDDGVRNQDARSEALD